MRYFAKRHTCTHRHRIKLAFEQQEMVNLIQFDNNSKTPEQKDASAAETVISFVLVCDMNTLPDRK